MKVERIDHIHIAVRNLDKAISFFETALGTKFSPPLNVEKDDLGNNIGMRSVLDPLGLEVFTPASERSAIHHFLEQRGEGLHAISFKVDDIEAAIKHLEESGMRLVGRITLGNLKEAQFHPKDSFGFMIELCEYQEKSTTYVACTEQDLPRSLQDGRGA